MTTVIEKAGKNSGRSKAEKQKHIGYPCSSGSSDSCALCHTAMTQTVSFLIL